MMVINPLNEELFDKMATEITYLKLFEHILNDFVSRPDMSDLLKPNNMVVQVAFPAGTGGVTSAILNPGLGPTLSTLQLKTTVKNKLAVGDVDPSKFLG